MTTVDRAVAFDRARDREGQREALGRYPELDAAFKRLYEVQQAGGDVEAARIELSRQLHRGQIVEGNVSVNESRNVIDNAAAYRGLMVRDADRLGGQFTGVVVAVSSHHTLLKVGDLVAVRYERANLARDLGVGERVTIRYGREQSQVYERGQEPQRERGRDSMQMMHERSLADGIGVR